MRGATIIRHLGHRYMTDVLELRISGALGLLRKTDAMQSLTFALLEGASEALESGEVILMERFTSAIMVIHHRSFFMIQQQEDQDTLTRSEKSCELPQKLLS